ncbi:hypothetical protein F4818DRAFT_245825 [Hypoxylon cercidicola]|nr:hypothetical protein F4818DRAFT_245825 [Hypoxylon cercidicola]
MSMDAPRPYWEQAYCGLFCKRGSCLGRQVRISSLSSLYTFRTVSIITYDHRIWKPRDPVRSPLDKPDTARSVAGSVTISESLVFVPRYVLVLSMKRLG